MAAGQSGTPGQHPAPLRAGHSGRAETILFRADCGTVTHEAVLPGGDTGPAPFHRFPGRAG